MNSDGTDPRRLAPAAILLGQDATCVYYQSHADNTFNSISIIDRDAQPKQIMTCSYSFRPSRRTVGVWCTRKVRS